MFFFKHHVADVKHAGNAGQYSENTQHEFAEFATKLVTKSHAGVFGKVQDAPVGKPPYLAQGVIEFDINFNELVDKQHQQNGDEWYAVVFKHSP